MFEHAIYVLKGFGEDVTPTSIYSLEAVRIDVEDYIYLIEAKQNDYILYETDYMFDADEAIEQMKAVSKEYGYDFGDLLRPHTHGKDDRILRLPDISRIYIAANILSRDKTIKLDPTTYGGVV